MSTESKKKTKYKYAEKHPTKVQRKSRKILNKVVIIVCKYSWFLFCFCPERCLCRAYGFKFNDDFYVLSFDTKSELEHAENEANQKLKTISFFLFSIYALSACSFYRVRELSVMREKTQTRCTTRIAHRNYSRFVSSFSCPHNNTILFCVT